MRIKAEQLSAQLSRKTSPVYLVSGDETLIVEESCDLIRAHLKNNGFDEREVLHVEAGFKWEYLLECANALSLFADKRLIEIRLGTQKINKAASKILQEYIKYAPAENTLLLIANKLDGAAKKSAWYKDIDQQGCIVEIWPIETQQLPMWLKNRAAAQNLQLTPDAIAILCDRIEGNLLAAKQELDKLQLLQGSSPLSAEDIVGAVSDSSRYDVFALMDAIIFGQSERSLKILQVLRQEAIEPTIILWAISREIRLLHDLKTGLDQGQSYESLCSKLRVWGKKKQSLKQAAMRQDYDQLEAMLRQCASVDQIIKGMKIGDHWLHITDITLSLSGSHLKLG
ncbi:MAG: DNA polymerase III subunit delta [Oceanospirillaceae bacterium]|nr:DNA polymerase III subunit delta [Oceanospirillaceae bacterium]